MKDKKFDCIVVLANEMDKEGILNNESVSRVQLACKSYNDDLSGKMITCGWNYRKDCELFIADVMKSYAVNEGIPEENIITEINSRDTVGDAFFSKHKIIASNVWKNLLIVTSDYHVERTARIFKFIYGEKYNIEVIGATCKDSGDKFLGEQKSIDAFNNTFINVDSGDDTEIFNALSSRHPFYNGTIYPQIKMQQL